MSGPTGTRGGNSLDTSQLQRLAAWATGVRPEDLPDASVASARRIFLDDIAAMIAGHRDSEVRTVVQDWPMLPGAATVLVPGAATAHPWSAAEVNALAGCWLEVDGGFRINTAHAGLYTIPTVLAIAEDRDLSIGEAFTAMIVGYELAARVVTRWDVARADSHAHGSVSAVAAAAAASRALGLDADGWTAAVTSAVTMSAAAPFGHAFAGAVVRNLWAAAGNRVGQMAAHAARHGVGGLATSIDDTYRGVFGSPPWSGATLSDEFGTAVQFAYQKTYACCGYLHSCVEAVLDLHAGEDFSVDDVVAVTARMHPVGLPLDDPTPPTTLGARFSAPHAIAATLVRGAATPASFDAESLRDPRISALRQKVSMVEIDRPGRDPALRDAEVVLELADGRTLDRYVAVAIGDPTRPMANEQLIDKAEALTGRDVRGFAELLLAAELDTPISEVSALLRGLVT
jgi:2-methylcitrate dehydratase PrpD